MQKNILLQWEEEKKTAIRTGVDRTAFFSLGLSFFLDCFFLPCLLFPSLDFFLVLAPAIFVLVAKTDTVFVLIILILPAQNHAKSIDFPIPLDRKFDELRNKFVV